MKYNLSIRKKKNHDDCTVLFSLHCLDLSSAVQLADATPSQITRSNLSSAEMSNMFSENQTKNDPKKTSEQSNENDFFKTNNCEIYMDTEIRNCTFQFKLEPISTILGSQILLKVLLLLEFLI